MKYSNCSRRLFFKNSIYSALLVSLRAASVGVPASFLTRGSTAAEPGKAKFSILSLSSQGEPLNCSAPGAYFK